MCVCVFVCVSNSALHWPDPGCCCAESPLPPAQERRAVDAQAGRLPLLWGRMLGSARNLQSTSWGRGEVCLGHTDVCQNQAELKVVDISSFRPKLFDSP